jgi:hypothetical protein
MSKLRKFIGLKDKAIHARPHPEHTYDIIGDVHGYHLALKKLLKKMGYSRINGIWTHPHQTAIFLGDFINRGPHSRKTLKTIKKMVQAGTAKAILGNHEISAILYFTLDKQKHPLRTPGTATLSLLRRFKSEYKGQMDKLQSDIKWLRSLPFFLDLHDIRVIHAYWSKRHIKVLEKIHQKGKLTRKILQALCDNTSFYYSPVQESLKGIEIIPLKNRTSNMLHDLPIRNYRLQWWHPKSGDEFQLVGTEQAFRWSDVHTANGNIPNYSSYPTSAPPLFLGHYCLNQHPLIPTPNVCCIDTCVAKGGLLSAYRWKGEKTLTPQHIIQVEVPVFKKTEN